MLSMLFENIYYLVDTIFVSRAGTVALAALSLAIPIFYFALAITKGIADGTTTLMSNARGQKDEEKTENLGRTAFPLLLLMLSPFFLLLIPGVCDRVASLLGATGPVIEETYQYTFWLVLGFPVMGYVFISQSICMSHGDSITPMKGILLGNLVNIVLDPFLIFYLDMGVGGAGLATFIGRIAAAVYLSFALRRHHTVSPSLCIDKGGRRHWRVILGLGIPLGISMIVTPLGLAAINRILIHYSTEAVGAWNIMSRIEMMVLLPLFGLSSTLIPFIAFNYGEKNYERIRGAVVICLSAGFAILIPVMIFFFFGAHWLVAISDRTFKKKHRNLNREITN